MPKIDTSTLQSIPFSYATCSLDNPVHASLPEKLSAISSAGFSGIELNFQDFCGFASETLGREVKEDDYDGLCQVGPQLANICGEKGLKIMMLQPFSNFEGWQPNTEKYDHAFNRAAGWIRVMKSVGCDMLQVGSTDSDAGDLWHGLSIERIADDLRKLCDLLAEHGFRLAYENWCWATFAPTWHSIWEIVKLVDRPNIGLCLDTFQTAGGEWGDPTTSSGRLEFEGLDEQTLMDRYRKSLVELSKTIPKDKIYLLQISDAYKVPSMKNEVQDGLRPRGRWSHDYRPLPYDGGYLPIEEMTMAVLQTGFRGWFSLEVFDSGKDGKGKKKDVDGYAKHAMTQVKKLIDKSVTLQ